MRDLLYSLHVCFLGKKKAKVPGQGTLLAISELTFQFLLTSLLSDGLQARILHQKVSFPSLPPVDTEDKHLRSNPVREMC